MPGQEFEVVGRSTEGGYLLIRDPANPEVLGWLKSEGAAVSGVLLGLPIPTPPPTPVDGLPPDDGCPTPIGGGPTPVSCPKLRSFPTPVGGLRALPTPFR